MPKNDVHAPSNRPMNSPDVAERFASALDADDFLEAAHLLEEDCLYSTHGREIRGREHVMASFVEASDWAHAHLDKITYEHTLVHSQAAATIRFVDIFEHRGQKVRHECLMHVDTGPNDRIRRLTLEDLPGERERVGAFLEAFGIKR